MMQLADTRIAVQIVIVDDTQTVAYMLAFATGFFALIAGLISSVRLLGGDLLYLFDALKMAASIYLTVGGIVGKSVLWGLI
jgi:hypothetical protein